MTECKAPACFCAIKCDEWGPVKAPAMTVETPPAADGGLPGPLLQRLCDISETDHARGCQGRQYSCDCGWDGRTMDTAEEAFAWINAQSALLAEKDAVLGKCVDANDVMILTIWELRAQLATATTLLAEKDAEIERLRRFLFPYADATQISGYSCDGIYLIGDEKSVKAASKAFHYAAQIEEYRTAFLERKTALEAQLATATERLADCDAERRAARGNADNAVHHMEIAQAQLAAATTRLADTIEAIAKHVEGPDPRYGILKDKNALAAEVRAWLTSKDGEK